MKGSVGSPKWVAKQMKAKGLQRLKWYCQMCEKQCRDEHGFRLHSTSLSHRAKIEDLVQKIPEFSAKFEAEFLAQLKAMPREPIEANRVYSEIIKDRDHVHMNATKWKSLSAFVRHLKEAQKVRIITMDPIVLEYIDLEEEARLAREQEQKAQKRDEQTNAYKNALEAQLKANGSTELETKTTTTNESIPTMDNTSCTSPAKPIKFRLKRK